MSTQKSLISLHKRVEQAMEGAIGAKNPVVRLSISAKEVTSPELLALARVLTDKGYYVASHKPIFACTGPDDDSVLVIKRNVALPDWLVQSAPWLLPVLMI